MAIRRSSTSRSKKLRKQQRLAKRRAARRSLHVESLEERQLLAIGPQLVSINTNDDLVLRPSGTVLDIAPQELTIRFDEGIDADPQMIDPNSLGGIHIRRSGGDGVFDPLDATTTNDVTIQPGYIGVGEHPNEVVIRFRQALPDDVYRIDILGTGLNPLMNVDGQLFDNDPNTVGTQDAQVEFELDLGAQVVAVVPQPITRDADGALRQDTKKIAVYFNNDDLDEALASDPAFYQLIFTNDTATNTDDATYTPVDVNYNADTDTAVLTFGSDIEDLVRSYDRDGDHQPDDIPGGTFRLRIGTDEQIDPNLSRPFQLDLPNTDAGSSFDDAYKLSDSGSGDYSNPFDGSQDWIVGGEIEPQDYVLDLPGASDEPGHRDIPVLGEDHVNELPSLEGLGGTDDTSTVADTTDGITTYYYNFQDIYGTDPFGNELSNLITDAQKQRAREVFQLYAYYAGVNFVETADRGLTIVTGDMRALDPTIPTGAGVVGGLAGGATAIMDNAEAWNDDFGGNWFTTALHEIGHLLGLGHSYDMPAFNAMGSGEFAAFPVFGNTPEDVFPGDADIVHLQHLFRPDSIDIDAYKFTLAKAGTFSAETIAERLSNAGGADASLLDTVVSLYNEAGELIARNDDYFSEDSFLEVRLDAGRYYVTVTAAGNEDFDPTVDNTGFGGTTQGKYDLRLHFEADPASHLADATGTLFDGDADGRPGGNHNFWFRAVDESDTLIVDKASIAFGTPDGSRANPYRNIDDALAAAEPGDVVRIVGNGGTDHQIQTLDDNLAYQIGFDSLGRPLEDGTELSVPQDVTVMVDAGAIFKMRRSSINVGSYAPGNSSAPGIDRSGGALQILGTPRMLDNGNLVRDTTGEVAVGSVYFTSRDDELIGQDANRILDTTPKAGDWGGIRFRDDVDRAAIAQGQDRRDWEQDGVFLNYVNHADIRYGGGQVVINSVSQVVNPIDMIDARPTVTNNTISFSADAAMAANPDAFEETNFNAPQYQHLESTAGYTSDYDRVGPEIHGNTLLNNTTNGLFVRVKTPAGGQLRPLTVTARWDDTDIVYVLSDALLINGTPGGPEYVNPLTGQVANPFTGQRKARLDAGLVIDPDMIVKLDGARIQVGIGAQLIAEGDAGHDVVFTSLQDDTYGAGGTYDTGNNNLAPPVDPNDPDADPNDPNADPNDPNAGVSNPAAPEEGDWSGIYFGPTSAGSLDYARVTYGGGLSKVESSFAGFNAIEIHQADVRLAHSLLDHNADGRGGQLADSENRYGLGVNEQAAVYVLGAQPVVIDNIIRNTATSQSASQAAAITINANALNFRQVVDGGRQRGMIDQLHTQLDNQGALIRGNHLENNPLNGLVVRGATLTTESVWDDTDIVHILFDEIVIPNLHTYGGLRLESSDGESLVVKLSGAGAGFTAAGEPLAIDDRIGGMLHVVGQPGAPVIFTSLADDTAGAGFTSDGKLQTDTNNDGDDTAPAPGDWRSLQLRQFSHDRNVQVITEYEADDAEGAGTNATPDHAQYLGALAPDEYAGDDNRRLGFNIYGFISHPGVPNDPGEDPGDVDVYSFSAEGGTEVWFDIDRTSYSLDSVLELVDANGTVIARSDNSYDEDQGTASLYGDIGIEVNTMNKTGFQLRDLFSTNPRDAGMRVVLPGPEGIEGTYHIRVRSNNGDLDNSLSGGLTSGMYNLQIRLRELDEFAGSTVQYADIRYATDGIDISGMPGHSPLIGEAAENQTANNDTQNAAQDIGNMLASDRARVSVGGTISQGDDVDWYKLVLDYQHLQGFEDGPFYASTIFDLDYADGLARANAHVSVFDEDGKLILTSNDSNVADDQPGPMEGADMDDLDRGSAGPLDSFLGNVEMPEGTYYIAVSSVGQLPAELNQTLVSNAANANVRLEPINSLRRIAEDHISGANNFSSTADGYEPQVPFLLNPNGSNEVPFQLGDVVLFVNRTNGTNRSLLTTVDPFTGAQETSYSGPGWNGYSLATGDIAMNPNGTLYTYSYLTAGDNRNNNAGIYHIIDTSGTGDNMASVIAGGITYGDGDLTAQGTYTDARNQGADHGWIVTAICYSRDGSRGWAVMNSGDQDQVNLFVQFTPGSGAILGPGGNNYIITSSGPYLTDANILDTTVGSLNGNIALKVHDVTGDPLDPLFPGNTTDGMTITVTPNGGAAVTFELDSGPEILVNSTIDANDPDAPVGIQDGETFHIGQSNEFGYIRFDFNTGQVLVTGGGDEVVDGTTFTITDSNDKTRTFEFDSDGILTDNDNIRVHYNAGYSPDQVADAVVMAVNGQNGTDFVVTAGDVGARVSISGDKSITLGAGAAGVSLDSFDGQSVTPGSFRINVEETWTADQIRQAIANAINAQGFYTASLFGDRLNVPDAPDGLPIVFEGGAEAHLSQDPNTAAGISDPSHIEIDFEADDTAEVLAQKIKTAIQGAIDSLLLPGVTVKIQQTSPDTVSLLNATVTSSDVFVLDPVGVQPGGQVTGIAQLNGRLYAVSENGNLYSVIHGGFGTSGTYITTVLDDDGAAIHFAGLTPGPMEVENGRYKDLLFGISTDGHLYAFTPDGELQHIFADAATSVATGVSGANGLAFSTLQHNLWHTTNHRGPNPGHGVTPTFEGDRVPILGGQSYYFGAEGVEGANGVRQATGEFNYNFPGGAHGSLVTESFDLSGYDRTDLPTLYFNYFLDTEDKDYTPGGGVHNTATRDSFRVYVSGDDGVWRLLATNDGFGYDDRVPDSEYIDPLLPNGQDVEVQQLFDSTGSWRQARVNLAPFAGQDDLRLRFDFSTAGDLGFGDFGFGAPNNPLNPIAVGNLLAPQPGREFRDGQQFTISTPDPNNPGQTINQVFEFDLENTLEFNTGAGTADGEGFWIDAGTGVPVRFEYDKDGTITSGSIGAVDGSQLSDGDTFTVAVPDPNIPGQFIEQAFEFDSGYVLQIPAAGGFAGGLADGDTFTITSGGVSQSFEFDSTSIVDDPNSIVIPIGGKTQAEIATSVRVAIQNAPGLNVMATDLGDGRVQVTGAPGTTVNVANQNLQLIGAAGTNDPDAAAVPFVPTASFAAADVAARVATAINNSAIGGAALGPDGLTATAGGSVVDLGGDAQVNVNNAPLTLSTVVIAVNDLMTASEVSQATEEAILAGVTSVPNTPQFDTGANTPDGETFPIGSLLFEFDKDGVVTSDSIGAVDGSQLNDGDTFTISIPNPNPLDPIQILEQAFEFDSGYVLQIPENGSGFGGLIDGDTFTITIPAGNSKIFEFDNDGVTDSGTIPIDINGATQAEIATRTQSAIASSGLGVNATDPGNGRVQVIAPSGTTLSFLSANLQLIGTPGTNDPDAEAVFFAPTSIFTPADMADSIAAAINNSALGQALTATVTNGSVVDLGTDAQVALGVIGATPLTLSTIVVPIDDSMTAQQVADAANAAIAAAALPSVETYRNERRLNVQGADLTIYPGAASFTLEGAEGVTLGTHMIHITAGMSAEEVAAAMHPIINEVFTDGLSLTDPFAENSIAHRFRDIIRVVGHDVKVLPVPAFDPDTGTPLGPVSDNVPVALGLAKLTPTLSNSIQFSGDQFGMFDDVARAWNNDHEGVYLDDIVIGFAERGEMATSADGNTNYGDNPDPDLSPNEILTGSYQLEMRRAEEYGKMAQPQVIDQFPTIDLIRAFDTNDRSAAATTFYAIAGSVTRDGDMFSLYDGLNSITFEFQDADAPFKVRQGNLPIFFRANYTEYEMARAIRNAINNQNRVAITAALGDGEVSGSASVFDSTNGNRSTSNQINLFGDVVRSDVLPLSAFQITGTPLDANGEVDGDALRDNLLGPGITPAGDAFYVGGDNSAGFFTGGENIIGMDSGIVLSTGDARDAEGPNTSDSTTGTSSFQGDFDLNGELPPGTFTTDTTYLEFSFTTNTDSLFFNFAFASEEYNEFVNSGFNDVFAFFLDGQNIALIPGTSTPVSIDTINGGNPDLGLPATNSQYYHNNDIDNGGQFLEDFGLDGFTSVLTAQATGLDPGIHTIKLAISDVGDTALDSAVFLQAGGFSSSNDDATLKNRTGLPGIRHRDTGDKNAFRDQGQIIIAQNIITDAAGFGIHVDGGPRSAAGNPPQGGVRNLRELNRANLAPGVTIANNVLAFNGAGGIYFAGDTGQPTAPTPYGRIINNTVYGGGTASTSQADIMFILDTSPSMGGAIDAVKTNLRLMDAAMQAAGIDARYGLTVLPDSTGSFSTDPLLLQDLTDFQTFTAVGSPFDLLTDSGGALENGSLAVQEALNDYLPGTTASYRPSATPSLVLVTNEDDDGDNIDFVNAKASLQSHDAIFNYIGENGGIFGAAGNTLQRYGAMAQATGGAAGNINDFLNDPSTFFANFAATIIAGLGGSGAGIKVENNASPTILNNIVAGLGQGLDIDASSQAAGTVVAGTLYQNNAADSVGGFLGDFPVKLLASDPLFVDPDSRNFYLAEGSKAIDSAIDSLNDRPELVRVTDPLGIDLSPVLAPTYDAAGQLRMDDPNVEPLDGLGGQVFKDRGAIDRADFVGPSAVLVAPRDNGPLDENSDDSYAALNGALLDEFAIQLLDGGDASTNVHGSGINDALVDSRRVTITRDGVPLIEGVDYRFEYDPTSNVIHLQPLPGVWLTGSTYKITLQSADVPGDLPGETIEGVADLAGNHLRPNRINSTDGAVTEFTIDLTGGVDFGDAPHDYPVKATQDGASHIVNINDPLYLGAGVSTEVNGTPSSNASDDEFDDGVTFDPTMRVNTDQTFTINASAAGKIDAWIDFNGDSDWNDPGEHVLEGVDVAAGDNAFIIHIPVTARVDTTFARFRLTSNGLDSAGDPLQPTGQALNGEVEDYQITFTGDAWQNPGTGSLDRLDVNDDGFVTVFDAMWVIQEYVNQRLFDPAIGTGQLPAPPEGLVPGVTPGVYYVDVNGDGSITPRDPLDILDYLIAKHNGTLPAAPLQGAVLAGAPASAADDTESGFFFAAADLDSLAGSSEPIVVDAAPVYNAAPASDESRPPREEDEPAFDLAAAADPLDDDLLDDLATDAERDQQETEDSARDAAFADLWA